MDRCVEHANSPSTLKAEAEGSLNPGVQDQTRQHSETPYQQRKGGGNGKEGWGGGQREGELLKINYMPFYTDMPE
jgi:hypothetical protein